MRFKHGRCCFVLHFPVLINLRFLKKRSVKNCLRGVRCHLEQDLLTKRERINSYIAFICCNTVSIKIIKCGTIKDLQLLPYY